MCRYQCQSSAPRLWGELEFGGLGGIAGDTDRALSRVGELSHDNSGSPTLHVPKYRRVEPRIANSSSDSCGLAWNFYATAPHRSGISCGLDLPRYVRHYILRAAADRRGPQCCRCTTCSAANAMLPASSTARRGDHLLDSFPATSRCEASMCLGCFRRELARSRAASSNS